VSFIFISLAETCGTERLARTRSGPHGFIVWPSSESQRMTPEPYPCEKMGLSVAHVGGLNLLDRPVVDLPRGDVSGLDEVA